MPSQGGAGSMKLIVLLFPARKNTLNEKLSELFQQESLALKVTLTLITCGD